MSITPHAGHLIPHAGMPVMNIVEKSFTLIVLAPVMPPPFLDYLATLIHDSQSWTRIRVVPTGNVTVRIIACAEAKANAPMAGRAEIDAIKYCHGCSCQSALYSQVLL
jgi:hypothetical protein